MLALGRRARHSCCVIAAGALAGWRLLRAERPVPTRPPLDFGVSRRAALAAVCLAAGLLAVLPLARRATDSHAVAMSADLYQSGALVSAAATWCCRCCTPARSRRAGCRGSDFVAGYGAAQAVPGPLFTFAGYLGAVGEPEPNGVAGGALALVAIFLPGLLLVVGAAPFWALLRARPGRPRRCAGVNAAVVGLLFAALCRPLVSTAVGDAHRRGRGGRGARPAGVARVPPWAVVAACAVAGQLLV